VDVGLKGRVDAPAAVGWIARTLENAGFETWAVGGAVRDVLLGKDSDDWDLATRARPGDVRKLFRRTVPIGIEHGTVGVLAKDEVLYEVTTFRRDVITTGRHAVVEFSDRIEEDLARRDFTINAIAWHPLRDELLDPFDGAGDLHAHRLRTVGDPADRFSEDYLRVLRALRFAGRFQLEIDEATWTALTVATAQLDILSRERARRSCSRSFAGMHVLRARSSSIGPPAFSRASRPSSRRRTQTPGGWPSTSSKSCRLHGRCCGSPRSRRSRAAASTRRPR
jgi:tRNA nucleotidyltransferase (CCA-adding enzyme)